ncbi:DNA helicase UvrD [Candidatus Pacearchaeota archaeon]|nr:DNA helicase UvrD [Candidatus Pacearchaeota archaeon]
MEIIADLHIHSRHSRATSKNLSIENLEKYAKIKGIHLLGTGDFQHPVYRKEIDEFLTEDSEGILRTKSNFPFVWQTEISLMYSQNQKGRAVHLVVLSPNKETSDKITDYLKSKGRVDYDGRPIFGISAVEFTKNLKAISEEIEIIPAHCMTPFFGIFGSKSGFSSLKECFQDQADKIYAVESGMSADPKMLWKLNEQINIVSFSDAHSFWPWRLGREATVFDIPELTYSNIIKAIREGIGLKGTIETPPSYGKYHYDGHRKCNFSSSPEQTKKLNGICPVCKKPLTIGVDYRVEQLAKTLNKPESAKEFYELVPLHEIISLYLSVSLSSKKVSALYDEIIKKFPNEFQILLHSEKEELLQKEIPEQLAELILLNRKNKLELIPGYDGEYGQILLPKKQATLF